MLIFITIVSLVAAATMGALAWRLAEDERRRSEARVAALIASLESDPPVDADLMRLDRPLDAIEPQLELVGATTATSESGGGELFAAAEREGTSAFGGLATVGLVAVLLCGGVALAWLVARAVAPAPPAAVAAANVQPLELLSLSSTRRGQDLAVTGVVRNPRSAARVDHVAAVVLLFDERGQFLKSGRAPLAVSTLAPGDECAFEVTVAAALPVSRYRVSFRAETGGLVPHVDRRSIDTTAPPATNAPASRRAGL